VRRVVHQAMRRSWQGLRLGAFGAGLLLSLPAPARAAEKIAVLVVPSSEKEAELAENLTEVIIAHAARHGGFEVAGAEELRARLGVETDRGAQACLDNVGCLGRAGVSLGVRRIVAGSVGTRGNRHLFNLNLNNVQEGRIESRVFRLVEGGVDQLIRAVQEAAGELFRPRVEPGKIQIASEPPGARVSIDHAYLGITPLLSPTLLPGKHDVRIEVDGRFPWTSRVAVRPGEELQIRLTPENLPVRRRWPGYVAYGSASLAALSLAAGGFLGVLSQVQPSGETRESAMADLAQKKEFATAANMSFSTGLALGAVSLFYFIRYYDDIFGRSERYEEAP
jgi:hypothetical protein